MEGKKIVVHVPHRFWKTEFTIGCAVADVSIDLEAIAIAEQLAKGAEK